MDKLKDIKDFVQVPDFSIYIFTAIVIVGFCVLFIVILKIYQFFKKRVKSKAQIAREKLSQIDFKNAKQTAYEISKYAIFLLDNTASQDLYNKLEKALEKYKYKKEVPEFSQEDITLFNSFKDICNV